MSKTTVEDVAATAKVSRATVSAEDFATSIVDAVDRPRLEEARAPGHRVQGLDLDDAAEWILHTTWRQFSARPSPRTVYGFERRDPPTTGLVDPPGAR